MAMIVKEMGPAIARWWAFYISEGGGPRMSKPELSDKHTVTIELPSEAVNAAADRGLSLTEWVESAVWSRIEDEAAIRETAARRVPGPWPGWETSTYVAGQMEYLTYHGPEGAEIHYHEDGYSYHRSSWRGRSSRPWMARTEKSCLRSADGKIRVFSTAEAAKNALESV